jgi:hypothetical protein
MRMHCSRGRSLLQVHMSVWVGGVGEGGWGGGSGLTESHDNNRHKAPVTERKTIVGRVPRRWAGHGQNHRLETSPADAPSSTGRPLRERHRPLQIGTTRFRLQSLLATLCSSLLGPRRRNPQTRGHCSRPIGVRRAGRCLQSACRAAWARLNLCLPVQARRGT